MSDQKTRERTSLQQVTKFIGYIDYTTVSLCKYIMTNVRSPLQGGGLWPNPERDKVYWTIWCDCSYCGKKIVSWQDNREDLDPMEITRYGQQEIEDEGGRIVVFSPAGNSPLFPDVYHLRNERRDLCWSCYEEVTVFGW